MNTANKDFRILSLDGGGAKGVYTLGVLREIEALTGRKICEEFDLIYGTSTGAIIAAMLGLGKSIDEVKNHYFDIVPDVMGCLRPSRKTAAIRKHAVKIFGDAKFDKFLTHIGIVTTNYDSAKPMIFKSSINQAHGSKGTFQPGFGCTIADALVASSAAFPYFQRVTISTANQGSPMLMDGGFVANNPTLLAIADATKAFNRSKEDLKVLSLGVGVYKETPPSVFARFYTKITFTRQMLKMLDANTNTVEQIRLILFPDVKCVRINDSTFQNEYQTSMFETDVNKLKKLNSFGRESFGRREGELKSVFGW